MHDLYLNLLREYDLKEIKKDVNNKSNRYFLCNLCLTIEDYDPYNTSNRIVFCRSNGYFCGYCRGCFNELKTKLVFCPEIVNLKKQVDCVQSSVEAHAVGVSNVYREMDKNDKELESRVKRASELVKELKKLIYQTNQLRENYTEALEKLNCNEDEDENEEF